MPTIYRRARVLMVGTLRFAHPTNFTGGSTAVPLLDQCRFLQCRSWSVYNSHYRRIFRRPYRQHFDHRRIARNEREEFFPSARHLLWSNVIESRHARSRLTILKRGLARQAFDANILLLLIFPDSVFRCRAQD